MRKSSPIQKDFKGAEIPPTSSSPVWRESISKWWQSHVPEKRRLSSLWQWCPCDQCGHGGHPGGSHPGSFDPLWTLPRSPAGWGHGKQSRWAAPGSKGENRKVLSAHDLLLLKILAGFSSFVSKNLCLDFWASQHFLWETSSKPFPLIVICMIFFRYTPPREGSGREKDFKGNRTWITSRHQNPFNVKDNGVGTWKEQFNAHSLQRS